MVKGLPGGRLAAAELAAADYDGDGEGGEGDSASPSAAEEGEEERRRREEILRRLPRVRKGNGRREGESAFKFRRVAARAKSVRVDVTHTTRGDVASSSDEGESDGDEASPMAGGYLQEELDKARDTTSTLAFRKFSREAWPLVQSLPELLHHREKVLRLLLELIEGGAESDEGKRGLQLLSALSRDLRGNLGNDFELIMTSLVRVLTEHAEGPEACGLVFRTMGYVIKYNARDLEADLGRIQPYYADLLGHRRDFVRRYAAETLAQLLRGVETKPLRRHLRELVAALASGCCSMEGERRAQVRARENILDGCSLLAFHTLKGVHGRLHSRGATVLRTVLASVQPAAPAIEDKRKRKAKKKKGSHGAGGEEEAEMLAWAQELAERCVALMCNHMRSPHSDGMWMELHTALGESLGRLRESPQDESLGVAVGRTAGLLAAAVSHHEGVLLRDPPVAAKQANLLTEVLVDASSDQILLAEGIPPTTRVTVVRLAAATIRSLGKQIRRDALKAVLGKLAATEATQRRLSHARSAATECGVSSSHL